MTGFESKRQAAQDKMELADAYALAVAATPNMPTPLERKLAVERIERARNALEAALEQQAEPVAREGFEKWAKSLPNYMDISRFEAGYSDCNTDYAWVGWQAALAQPQQQAEPVYRKNCVECNRAKQVQEADDEWKADLVKGREILARQLAEQPEQQAEPTCPDCKAAVLYECVACSSNNYPPKQQAEPASGCACRWDHKDDRVATCERHQGWLDVIAEWADRARAAEAKLKAAQLEQQAEPAPIYYMRDNHTFKKLSAEVSAALVEIESEFNAGYTYGSLISRREGFPQVHASGSENRLIFFRECKTVLENWIDAPPQRKPLTEQQQQAEPVLQEIEQYRMQMAGISTAAIGYWKEGDGIHPDYDTLALRDVAKLYAKYDELYKAQPVRQAEPTCPDCKAAVLYECVACSSNNYPPKQQQAEPSRWLKEQP